MTQQTNKQNKGIKNWFNLISYNYLFFTLIEICFDFMLSLLSYTIY